MELLATKLPISRRRPRRAAVDLVGLVEVRWAACSVVLFAMAAGGSAVGFPAWLTGAFYAGCYVSGGWEPGRAGLRARRRRTLDVDLLMVVAALVAAAIGQTFDGALLIVIFAASGATEAVATKRTADSVQGLLDLAPEQATRVDARGSEVQPAPWPPCGISALSYPSESLPRLPHHVVPRSSELGRLGHPLTPQAP